MILDPDCPLAFVRRVYIARHDGDCYDFGENQLVAVLDAYSETGSDAADVPIWDDCQFVVIGADARDQFKDANWNPEAGSFWIAAEDVTTVPDDLDARIRAMVALTDQCPLNAEDLFVNEVHKDG
jgi:hypothetical protein